MTPLRTADQPADHGVPGTDADDLPLSTHHLVLGADVHVKQRATHTHDYARTREKSVRVEPYTGKPFTQQRQRAYLAAWARRTLFDGEPAGGSA